MATCWTILIASTPRDRATSLKERRSRRRNWVHPEAASRTRRRRSGERAVAEGEAEGEAVAARVVAARAVAERAEEGAEEKAEGGAAVAAAEGRSGPSGAAILASASMRACPKQQGRGGLARVN
eukprot:scaffold17299_cov69-Isochrysis_galbana.AAC.1